MSSQMCASSMQANHAVRDRRPTSRGESTLLAASTSRMHVLAGCCKAPPAGPAAAGGSIGGGSSDSSTLTADTCVHI